MTTNLTLTVNVYRIILHFKVVKRPRLEIILQRQVLKARHATTVRTNNPQPVSTLTHQAVRRHVLFVHYQPLQYSCIHQQLQRIINRLRAYPVLVRQRQQTCYCYRHFLLTAIPQYRLTLGCTTFAVCTRVIAQLQQQPAICVILLCQIDFKYARRRLWYLCSSIWNCCWFFMFVSRMDVVSMYFTPYLLKYGIWSVKNKLLIPLS